MIDYTYTHIPERSNDKVDVYSFSPLNICFVGPRGVGKTSLLASMSFELKKGHCADVFIDQNTKAGRYTSIQLERSWGHMLSMIDDTPEGELVPAIGIEASSETHTGEQEGREFIFTGRFSKQATFKTKEFLYPFRFVDMPGGWYTDVEKHADTVNQVLGNSTVSFLTVDTPAMMKGMAMHVKKNRPSKIYDWYNSAMSSLKQGVHMVIIVLSRCEAYWDRKELLLEKVKERYEDIIALLKNNEISIAIVPIQTLGGVKFQNYDPKGEAQFIRTGEYKPVNCVTPLRIALTRGLVNAVLKMKEEHGTVIDDILNTLGVTHYDIAAEGAKLLAEKLLNIDKDDAWFL